MAGQKLDPEWGVDIFDQKHHQTSLLDILSDLPIFGTLSWEELKTVELILHRRHFIAGETVIQAWVPRSGLFVVLSGRVDIVGHRKDGSLEMLDDLGPGELLGEFSILDDSPRSTSIVAAEPSELIGFFRPDLMDLIRTDPRMGFKILFRLSTIMTICLQELLMDLKEMEDLKDTETLI